MLVVASHGQITGMMSKNVKQLSFIGAGPQCKNSQGGGSVPKECQDTFVVFAVSFSRKSAAHVQRLT